MEFNKSNVIDYDKAMEILNTGKYYYASKNLICDYCMTSNLQGSWKKLINDDIDLCMNCFIKLRNNNNYGQKTLPISGKINNSDITPSMTFMMQDSVRPHTFMMQDSVRINGKNILSQTNQDLYTQDNIKQKSAFSSEKDNISYYSLNNKFDKFSFID
jgi:hypothetical protein